uniref:Uncharacterized protein n=1 Tax=Rhodnius prolixus TaxID=13249 RepID=T1IB08_RHOPR
MKIFFTRLLKKLHCFTRKDITIKIDRRLYYIY